jgi:hypothetical protein
VGQVPHPLHSHPSGWRFPVKETTYWVKASHIHSFAHWKLRACKKTHAIEDGTNLKTLRIAAGNMPRTGAVMARIVPRTRSEEAGRYVDNVL